MPPKVKKPKVKKDKSVKAIAKTKKGSAQAQTTNVVVKVGETKKPARRRRPPAKAKSTGTGIPTSFPPSGPDGWYPPQNLQRNGATFAGPEIRYVNVPTPATTSFIAGGASTPQTLVPSAPPMLQSGFDSAFAEEGEPEMDVPRLEMPKPSEMQRALIESSAPPTLLIAPPEEPPTFTEVSSRPKVSAPPRVVGDNSFVLADKINSVKRQLQKKVSNKELLGSNWVKDKGLNQYSIPVLQRVLADITAMLENEQLED